MGKQLYFEVGGEFCHDKDEIFDLMKFDGETEKVCFKAVRVKDKNVLYCKALGEVGEKSEFTCGKQCYQYKPINGKSGKCKHQGMCYEPAQVVTFKIKKSISKIK